jgi:hypothetical protein
MWKKKKQPKVIETKHGVGSSIRLLGTIISKNPSKSLIEIAELGSKGCLSIPPRTAFPLCNLSSAKQIHIKKSLAFPGKKIKMWGKVHGICYLLRLHNKSCFFF